MLATDFTHANDRGLPDRGQSPADLIAAAVGVVRRRFLIILSLALLGSILAAIYLAMTPKTYTATAQMMIDTHRLQIFQQKPLIAEDPFDYAAVESQLLVLKSENVALSVVNKLHLTEDQEFVGLSGGTIDRLLAPFWGQSSVPADQLELTNRAIGMLDKNLKVSRVGGSYAIEITFKSRNRNRAAEIANAIADAYVDEQLNTRLQATKQAGLWLQDRLTELRQQERSAGAAVTQFKADNHIVTANGRLISEDQLNQLNSQLVTARAQTSEAQARLDRIEAVIKSDNPDSVSSATVSDTLNNPIITRLRAQYLDYVNRETDWSVRLGNNHQAVLNLRRQIRAIRNSMLDELKRIAETYKSDYEIARQRQQSFEKSLAEMAAQSATVNQARLALENLENSAQSYRTLYDTLFQRYVQSVQEQSSPDTEAKLIKRASPQGVKVSPNRLLIMTVGAFGGIIFGLGFGALRELTDRAFRTPGQAEAATQVECVALVPFEKSAVMKGRGRTLATELIPSRLIAPSNVMWKTVASPISRYAEAIRAIKLVADTSELVSRSKVIGFTSALPSEGKSTIAGSLALLTAEVGARAILVDCDLRNPWLSKTVTKPARAGLLEVISGEVSLEEALLVDPTTNLSFLPNVSASPLAHSNELFATCGMKTLMEQLRKSFDYIVLDLPPLAPIVDVRSTIPLVDAYFLVVEWGQTKVHVVECALKEARGVHQKLAGVILNKTAIDALAQYGGLPNTYYGAGYPFLMQVQLPQFNDTCLGLNLIVYLVKRRTPLPLLKQARTLTNAHLQY